WWPWNRRAAGRTSAICRAATSSALRPRNGRRRARASLWPRGFDSLRDVGRRLGEIDDDLRRPLADPHAFALGVGERRRGALAHGIEGHEFHLLVGLQRRLILQRRDHRGVDGVAILDLRGQGGGQDAILRVLRRKQDWIAERELVLGQGPGLVRA